MFHENLSDIQNQTIQKIQQAFARDAKEEYNGFKYVPTLVKNDARPGMSSKSRMVELIEKVSRIIMESRRVTIQKIAHEVEVSTGSILTYDSGNRSFIPSTLAKLLWSRKTIL